MRRIHIVTLHGIMLSHDMVQIRIELIRMVLPWGQVEFTIKCHGSVSIKCDRAFSNGLDENLFETVMHDVMNVSLLPWIVAYLWKFSQLYCTPRGVG